MKETVMRVVKIAGRRSTGSSDQSQSSTPPLMQEPILSTKSDVQPCPTPKSLYLRQFERMPGGQMRCVRCSAVKKDLYRADDHMMKGC